MCIATIETVILTLETLETAKIEFLGVHGRPILVLAPTTTWYQKKMTTHQYYRSFLFLFFYLVPPVGNPIQYSFK